MGVESPLRKYISSKSRKGVAKEISLTQQEVDEIDESKRERILSANFSRLLSLAERFTNELSNYYFIEEVLRITMICHEKKIRVNVKNIEGIRTEALLKRVYSVIQDLRSAPGTPGEYDHSDRGFFFDKHHFAQNSVIAKENATDEELIDELLKMITIFGDAFIASFNKLFGEGVQTS